MTMLAFLTTSWWNPTADSAEEPRSTKLATGTGGPIVKEKCNLTFVWENIRDSTRCLREENFLLDASSMAIGASISFVFITTTT